MKRLCSSCLLGIVILFATPLQQLIKVPVLIEHYQEHKLRNGDLTFLDFMFMHYVSDDGVHDDDNRDMQLPFKKSNTGQFLQDVCQLSPADFLALYGEYLILTSYPPDRNAAIITASEKALLKPPQLV